MDKASAGDQSAGMTNDTVELRVLTSIGDEIGPLIVEAGGEGHRFLHRLRDEWESGQNRFQEAGEVLWGAYVGGRLVAVGGLNRDPFAGAAGIGRLRHVYVARSARRTGIGTMLVDHIRDRAARTFSVLRLRTTTAEAAAFYARIGFETTTDEAATHLVRLDAMPAGK